jgi:hypothetical protein
MTSVRRHPPQVDDADGFRGTSEGRVSVSAAALATNWEMVRTHRTRGSRVIPAKELGAERYAQALHRRYTRLRNRTVI